jgi:signal transduction histidine kinase
MTLRQANEERILVMAPTGRDAELVCALLQGVGLICAGYTTLESFRSALDNGVGALLITTEALSPAMVQTLAHVIAEQPSWSDLSLVLLSQHNQNISITALHEQLGVNASLALLERPVHPSTLLALFQSLIQGRRRQYQIRDLLAQLVAQTTALAQEVEQRKIIEAEQERLLHELAQERAQLHDLTQTLEQKVRAGTQKVRDLAIQLSLAEHDERQRVARILHDHVQQMLYATQFQAQLLEINLSGPNSEIPHKYLNEMRKLINETVYSVRTLSVDLSPPVLENEGLPEALRWLASQIRDRYGLMVEIEGDFQVADKHLRTMIFQIGRELLFNVVKHAGVDEARVTLDCQEDLFHLIVQDKGVGFDPSAFRASEQTSTGFGLTGIGRRLDLFNGHLTIESTPGAGTVVAVTLPLN